MAEASPTVKHGKAGLTVPEIFAGASPFAVERAARRLRSRLRHDRWLASTNIYLHQAPGVVKEQFEHLGKPQAPVVLAAGTLEASQLAESIAASTILHCADGWSYLGRAMAAQLRGDSSTSRHLAYYAELRAAASLLASQGIGMFAGPHVILKESNDVEIFRQYGTHQFAWLALAQWTDLSQSVDLLGSVIQPADAALADWLVPLGGGGLWQETGREYLHTWGLDVERFGRDREARNDSSYQPRTAFGASPPSSRRAAEFGTDLWRLFEPSGATSFGTIDRYLLRRIMKRLFEARTGESSDENPDSYRAFFGNSLDTLQTSESPEQLTRFLSGESFPEEPPLFAEAEQDSNVTDSEDHLQVTARAALLLRVASGAAQHLLGQVRLSYPDYEWWGRQLAAGRAIAAEADDSLLTPALLWDDMEGAINGLDEKIAEGEGDSYVDLNARCAEELTLLGGCERIALWSLAA